MYDYTVGRFDYVYEWDERNEMHNAEHGVVPGEAEYVIEHARREFPRKTGDRRLVWGRTAGGYFLQVVFVLRPGTGAVRVIHARPLTDGEKSLYRRNER